MQSGYKVTCERDDCFACVNGECVILVENNFHGEEFRFFKTKEERALLAFRYEKEAEVVKK